MTLAILDMDARLRDLVPAVKSQGWCPLRGPWLLPRASCPVPGGWWLAAGGFCQGSAGRLARPYRQPSWSRASGERAGGVARRAVCESPRSQGVTVQAPTGPRDKRWGRRLEPGRPGRRPGDRVFACNGEVIARRALQICAAIRVWAPARPLDLAASAILPGLPVERMTTRQRPLKALRCLAWNGSSLF